MQPDQAIGNADSGERSYLDLNNLQFAKWIGLYDARGGAVKRRQRMCSGCPFNPDRDFPPIDTDVMATITSRIQAGEQWICHQTCDGARETPRSLLCAGAPA